MKSILTVLMVFACIGFGTAQTVVLDFEDPATSTTFQYFGGSLEGVINNVIANPNPTGINTSATVGEFIQGGDAPDWGGAFSNPDPTVPIDLIGASEICIDFHRPAAGNVMLKLEGSSTAANWEQVQETTAADEWQTICYDVTLETADGSGQIAAGNVYTRIVLFFDFGTPGNGSDVANYFDNIVINPAVVVDCTTILDFEEAATSTTFQYFGGSLEGVINMVVANPNPGGSNTSATVAEFIQVGDAPDWGGAFSNPDPTSPVDLIGATEVCIDVHRENAGNLRLKLEAGTGPNWELEMPTTAVGEWETICFDVTQPSAADPFEPGAGNVYNRVVLFFDFGVAGTGTDVFNYFDNIVVCSEGGTQTEVVTFSVDMNEYPDTYTQPYVSGSFNGWCGDCNPLDDTDGDGVWEGDIELELGQYEFKFTLDNWAAQEEFTGLEECTNPPGGYVNRQLVVNGNTDLGSVCFNSCYACADRAVITFNLGFPDGVTPDPDGEVYLAGGGNFESPGGTYRMTDGDGDGVYSITFERQIGFESYYTFANGNCPDFSCKEDINGQDCANPDNFNDRLLEAVTGDVTINTCFGQCTETTDCGTVSTSDVEIDNDMVMIIPTLVEAEFQLTFLDGISEAKDVRIFDLMGKEIYRMEVEGMTEVQTFDASDWQSGMYLVHVQIGNRLATQKIMKL